MPDPIDVAVGVRVKLRRRQLGLSQSDLGSHLNLTFQQIQKYENGANRVSASVLAHIAQRLDCSIASLFGEETDQKAGEGQEFSGLAHPGALDLVQAYAASAPRHRKLLLELARAFAAPGPAQIAVSPDGSSDP